MEYVLTTDHLCKNYGHFKALNQCSMHVPRGAIYGFVGKNGAGKTTLIRLICGLQDRHPEVTGYMEAKIRTRKFWKRREESAQLWRPRRFIWI